MRNYSINSGEVYVDSINSGEVCGTALLDMHDARWVGLVSAAQIVSRFQAALASVPGWLSGLEGHI